MEEKIYGLIGGNLSHSYSVPVHKMLGNEAYRLFEIKPTELEGLIRDKNIGGLNVTIPYKTEAMRYCDTISAEAKETGSVNTIVRREGLVCGYNTDKYGFFYMLKKAGIEVNGKKVIILGSGGAGKTALSCVKSLGAKSVYTVSRNGENNYNNIEKHYDADVIINATPVGMYPSNGESAVDLEKFGSCSGVVDMIYNPLRTKLILDAEKKGIAHTGGLSMLVAQAKAAAEIFFEKKYPDSVTDRITNAVANDKENIVLIGMPGSGKSAIGTALANLTGREIIDTDEYVEKEVGKSVPRIFAEDGEAAFRETESRITARAGKQSGKIIVTGGGAVTVATNYNYLKQNGRIYEIKRDLSLLSKEGRPLSENADLRIMYETRKPMYEKFRDAEIINDKTPEYAAELIRRDFYENSRY